MAIPALRAPPADPASAWRRDILRGIRLYVAGIPADARDAAGMLEGLRQLQRCMDGLGVTTLTCAARAGAPAASRPMSLGLTARHLVAWLREHPERADEPLEWLIADLPDGPGATAAAEDPGSRNSSP